MMPSFIQWLTEAKAVGKFIGGERYIHKSYEHLLPQDELTTAKSKLPDGFKYDVVKHNHKEGTFSFIHSHDFDSNPEPTVGDSVKVHKDGRTTLTKKSTDPKIYHGKEDMVGRDYSGFDVDKAKERSTKYRKWIQSNGGKEVSSRMGTSSKWNSLVVDKGGLE